MFCVTQQNMCFFLLFFFLALKKDPQPKQWKDDQLPRLVYGTEELYFGQINIQTCTRCGPVQHCRQVCNVTLKSENLGYHHHLTNLYNLLSVTVYLKALKYTGLKTQYLEVFFVFLAQTISSVKEKQCKKKDVRNSAKAKNHINSLVYKKAEMHACQDG